MRHECYFCHIKTVEKLVEKFKPTAEIAEGLIFSIHDLLARNKNVRNPFLARDIHRAAREHLGNMNLFKEEKNQANTILLNKYRRWKDRIDTSNNPFFTAAKLSVIGNVIDYGAHSVQKDISEQIESLFSKNLAIDQGEELCKEIKKARAILFLGDNAGEIVFDKLFIETFNHHDVTYAVRGNPVINDVTLADASQCGMDKICRIIPNGFDAPSTLLEFCSDEFRNIFNNADLVISKGQGNFEGLMKCEKPNIFFMLMAKCNPMAEMLGVNKGDMVLRRNIR